MPQRSVASRTPQRKPRICNGTQRARTKTAVHRSTRLSKILDDLRFTLRQLRRAPAFVITAVLTLTLSIAANIVVYGIANAMIFRPLPVQNPRELVQVQNPGFAGISFSYPNYRDLRERTAQTFSSLSLFRLTRFSISIDGTAQPVWGFMVSGNYFSTLGIQPQLGRLLTPADDITINGSPVMV